MIEVFGFYKFILINQLNKQKVLLNDFLVKKNIRGTIIISKEGINGSISGKSKDIKSLINQIKKFFYLNRSIAQVNLSVHFNHSIKRK